MPSAGADARAGWGCLVLVFGGAAFGFWLFGGWVGSFLGAAASRIGAWIGLVADVALFCFLAVGYARHLRRGTTRDRASKASEVVVEEVRVSAGRAVAVEGDHSSIGPGVCIEIGGGKLLLLVGQWLRDPARLGIPGAARREFGDEGDEYLNGLAPPWAFPATSFRLRRVRSSGEVLSLRIEGSYIPPTGEPLAIEARDFDAIPQSAILEGDLSDIPTAMRRSSPPITRSSR